VRLKLWTDPSLDVIAGLGALGRVVDAGAGMGHVGLGLLDQHRATSLVAIERDAERLAVGRAAAGQDATFEEGDLRVVPFPPCDTVLFADSLHYIAEDQQRSVLARAATALAPGGRIVIRDIDSTESLRSRFTKSSEERAARRRGVREPLHFHPAEIFASMLREVDLDAVVVPHEQWSITADFLVVGTKPFS
jgi:SAM-dependent methyltransferase